MFKRTGKDQNNIDEIAAKWVARCDRGRLHPTDQVELDRWLARDPRHRGAYARAQAIVHQLEDAAELVPQFLRQTPIVQMSRRRFLWAASSAVAALGFGGWVLFGDTVYATEMGQMLRVPLPDGSMVTLNTASQLRVPHINRDHTAILTTGEAFFEIASHGANLFALEAGAVSIRSTAAIFSVRCLAQSTEVLVRHGELQLSSEHHAELNLSGGNAFYIAYGKAVSRAIPLDEIDRRLAWRDGNLAFASQTLAEATDEYARYSRQKIILDDTFVAQRRIVGLFAANDPEGFARAVGRSLDLDVRMTADGIHLARRR